MSLLFMKVPCKKSSDGFCPQKTVNASMRHAPCEYDGKCPYEKIDKEEDKEEKNNVVE